MRIDSQHLFFLCIFPRPRSVFPPILAHQVVLTIGQNFWTAEVASGIQAGAGGLKKIYDMHCKQLEAIVALVRGPQVFL